MARHAAPGNGAGARASRRGPHPDHGRRGSGDGGGGAQAGELSVPAALAGVADPISNLKVNPLAHTGVDPLDNGVATKIADFPSVGTGMVTGVLTQGPSVGELPTAAASSLLGPLLPAAGT